MLLTSEESLLRTLPPNLLAEAHALRSRFRSVLRAQMPDDQPPQPPHRGPLAARGIGGAEPSGEAGAAGAAATAGGHAPLQRVPAGYARRAGAFFLGRAGVGRTLATEAVAAPGEGSAPSNSDPGSLVLLWAL